MFAIHKSGRVRSGFSLLEMLVSVSILSIIFVILLAALFSMTSSWQRSTSLKAQFDASRSAFDAINTRLSEAELSPYWDYEYADADRTKSPSGYVRTSDLHFVSGSAETLAPSGIGSRPTHSIFFHGAFGIAYDDPANALDDGIENMDTLLNGWGFFLEFGPSPNQAAFFNAEANLTPRYRYRLMELQQPSEELSIFNDGGGDDGADLGEATTPAGTYSWFRDAIASDQAHPIAENVIALIVLPVQEVTLDTTASSSGYLSLAPDYSYDSRALQILPSSPVARATAHRLPPLVRVTLVALDEPSANRLELIHGTSPPPLVNVALFQDPEDYDDDLAALETSLVDQNLNFRVFSTLVRLRNSRWNDINP